MTEDEAKTKWCPAYRVATSGGDATSTYEMDNRPREGIAPPDDAPTGTPWTPGPTLGAWSCCIGSACMAWRAVWVERPVLKDGTTPGPGEAYLRTDVAKVNRHSPGGFCGLAGAPQ